MVSIKMILYPAASHNRMASLVVLVTPPNVPLDGEGRIKAFQSLDNSNILVLSPNKEPVINKSNNHISICLESKLQKIYMRKNKENFH